MKYLFLVLFMFLPGNTRVETFTSAPHITTFKTTTAAPVTLIFATKKRASRTRSSVNCTRSSSKNNITTDKFAMGFQKHNKGVGSLLVRLISSWLPYADNVGHSVLHANNEFISYVMNLDENKVPHKWKGKIILCSIQLAQWGDKLGGDMLRMYYNIVKHCFDDE